MTVPARFVLAGAGNVGSHLALLLARFPGPIEIVIIDHDSYSPANLATQCIFAAEVGVSKALALARRLREINRAANIVPFASRLEEVPLGCFANAIVLGALDSRSSRFALAQRAWRAGSPHLDAGVNADAGLVRVSAFVPGDGPCYGCGLSDEDFAAAGAVYACDGSRGEAPPSGAPAWLGSLAASLLAAECERVRAEGNSALDPGADLVLAPLRRQWVVSRRARNPRCRFDHCVLRPEPFFAAPGLPLGDVIDQLSAAALCIELSAFVTEGLCCDSLHSMLRVRGRGMPPCPACGAPLRPVAVSERAWIDAAALRREHLAAPFSSLGFRPRDFVRIRSRASASPESCVELLP
jgi:molybdopterin/thiamine biosynthesis adenylyltransferase